MSPPKAVNFSLRYGHTEQSSFAYGVFALMLVSLVGDLATAFQYSEMSLRLNEKLKNPRLRGTLLHLHGDHVNFWRRHISTGIDRKSTRLNSSHTVISYSVFC